jgi:hypothetical protein
VQVTLAVRDREIFLHLRLQTKKKFHLSKATHYFTAPITCSLVCHSSLLQTPLASSQLFPHKSNHHRPRQNTRDFLLMPTTLRGDSLHFFSQILSWLCEKLTRSLHPCSNLTPASISSKAFHLSFAKGKCCAVWTVRFSVDVHTCKGVASP